MAVDILTILGHMLGSIVRVCSHVLPIGIFVLVLIWMSSIVTMYSKESDGSISQKDLFGFSWTKNNSKVFNWHPVLMTFGLILCLSQAILIFETKPFPHHTNKLIHVACHSLSILSIIVGLLAVFRFHNEHGIPNLYSLHSWIGIATLLIFSLQYAIGFLVFLYPGVYLNLRMLWMPYHIGFGMAIIGMACVVAVSGIMEKLTFNGSCNINGELEGYLVKAYMAPDCLVGNIAGLLILLYLLSLVTAIWISKQSQNESSTRNSDHDSMPEDEEPLLKKL